MYTLRLTFIFLIGMVLTALLTAAGVSRWLLFVLVILFYLLAMVLPGVYITYFSKSLKRIGRYVGRNRRKAIFAFPYALEHGTDRDIEDAIERILAVHKQPAMQAVYKSLLAIYRDQPEIAAQHAQRIDREPLRSYYLAHAAVASGELDLAAELNTRIDEPWMANSIRALIAYEQKVPEFQHYADNSIEAARGVQKYTLYHSFERMKWEDTA